MSLVTYTKYGATADLCLNRPNKLNAINGEMLDQLDAALNEAEADDDIRVLVLSGEGRAFSAGFDLDMGSPAAGESQRVFLRRELKRSYALIMRFWDFRKPTIAAVHGYCLGSSMEISAVCDITIAAEGCRFGAPEVRFGSGIVCMILPWIVGQKNAREILLVGGDNIDARRAQAIGLVNKVVTEEELMETAGALAEEIALNDPLAVQLTKSALNYGLEVAGMREALETALEIDIEIESTETPESREFNRIMDADGAKAALAWRALQLPSGKEH
jgi:enoyl-CoA hydratase/carnithine racemase